MFELSPRTLGLETGLNNKTMWRLMTADGLRKMAATHRALGTEHDMGMAKACDTIAYVKEGGKGCEYLCSLLSRAD